MNDSINDSTMNSSRICYNQQADKQQQLKHHFSWVITEFATFVNLCEIIEKQYKQEAELGCNNLAC